MTQGGLGFISMKERVHILGGEMQVSSQPRCGTRSDVAVPLRPATIVDKEPENLVDSKQSNKK